tara:strand:+ start:246 stop:755 length:510 start_codon:yes stop_codon:yes gene_type:complete
MACSITLNGYELSCKDNVGGLETVYIFPFSSSTTYTKIVDGSITGITGGPSGKEYEQRPETANFAEAITANIQNGTVVYENTLTLSFTKLDQALRNEVKEITKGRVTVITKDANGKFWLHGEGRGGDVNGGSLLSGTAFADKNGVDLTILFKEKEPAVEITEAAFSGLI